MKRLIVAALCQLLCISVVHADADNFFASDAPARSTMSFTKIPGASAHNENQADTIFQDSFGFIWTGGHLGLSRFDGQATGLVRKGLAGKSYFRPYEIGEDSAGDLILLVEDRGVWRWLRDAQQAVPLRTDGEFKQASAIVVIDEHLWVGTKAGAVIQLDMRGEVVNRWEPERDGLTYKEVFSLMEHSDGKLYIGSALGLFHLEIATGELGRVPVPGSNPDAGTYNGAVLSLAHSGDTVWVGTYWNGLHRLDPGARSTVQIPVRGDDQFQVNVIAPDPAHGLWLSTVEGLYLVHPDTLDVAHYVNVPENPSSLSGNAVGPLLIDRSGMLWVSAIGAGLDLWNPRTWRFGLFDDPWARAGVVTGFAHAPDGQLWVSNQNGGLRLLDTDRGLLGAFTAENGYADLGATRPMSVWGDDRELWIGLRRGGLRRFDYDTRTLKRYVNTADPRSLPADGVMSILRDRENRLWIGTYVGGLVRYVPETDDFNVYAHGPLFEASIGVIHQDVFGNIWLGTRKRGLLVFDPDTGTVTRVAEGLFAPEGLDTASIFAIESMPNGDLWVGSIGGGLFRLPVDALRAKSGDFEKFEPTGKSQELSSLIYSLQADGSGDLWVGTETGLARVTPDNEIAQSKIRIFRGYEGLQSDGFTTNAHYFDPRNDTLTFAGSGGINSFRPAAVSDVREEPQLVITGIDVLAQPAQLDVAPERTRELTLSHRDTTLTVKFAALDYAAPQANLYSWKLEGFDKSWSTPDNRNRATYTNLDAGHYTLKVRAANSDGVWTPEPLALSLRVLPAPWATWWAQLIYLALALAIAWYLIKQWTDRVSERAYYNHFSRHDRATGLPNRDTFEETAQQLVDTADLRTQHIGVIAIQLGPFRHLNTLLEFQQTEHLINAVSMRVDYALRAGPKALAQHALGRVSEHTLAVAGVFESQDAPLQMAEHLNTVIARPLSQSGHPVNLIPITGITQTPEDSGSIAELLSHASIASLSAVGARHPKVVRYEAAIAERASEALAIERDLREALANDAVDLYYQPKYDFAGVLTGAEALARWRHPERGQISPGVFIPIAEQSDLIEQFDAWALQRAMQDQQRWAADGLSCVPVSVNLSAQSFTRPDLIDIIESRRVAAGISSDLIELEITESMLVDNINESADTLSQLRALGYEIALDDFGTGYSSLMYLQRFPFTKVKIDRAFVKGVADQPSQEAICAAVVALAEPLGLVTVAEGVEDETQLEKLAELGADQMQGFLFSPGVPVEQFTKMLQSPADPPFFGQARPVPPAP